MKHPNDSPPAPERAELEQQVESLRRDIRKLQLEHNILKKANALIEKSLGFNPPLLTNREKTVLVDVLKETYALTELFEELGLHAALTFIIGRGFWAPRNAGLSLTETPARALPKHWTGLY